MFKSDAKLFLRASNNVQYAKTLINECKRLIIDFDLEGNNDCKNFKKNINDCNIISLVTRIEDTKESLIKLDSDFASDYMKALQESLNTDSINTSNMTEEEKMQYSIQMNAYAREYNYNLLYMLEKYEESGMLTDEMKQQLQYQRELVAQYDIQDKMAVLDQTSEEYINLFKQSAKIDKQLIELDYTLTEEQKNSKLKEYDLEYNSNLKALQNARESKIKYEKELEELNELYKMKEDNNGFWHPFVESEIDEAILDKKISIIDPSTGKCIATEDEIKYKNMNGWDRFCVDAGTFAASTFTGLYNITEGIDDAFVMLGSAVGVCDKEWASEFVNIDRSAELYDGIVLSNNMNTSSAYGTWHDAGLVFGDTVGKFGISFAAPWASATLMGLSAMGQSSEESLKNGDSYWTAFAKGAVSGVGGAAEGYGFSKLNMGAQQFLKSGALGAIKTASWNRIKNVFTSPITLKSVSKKALNLTWTGIKRFFIGGLKGIVDPDALIETGCVISDNFIDGLATGEWDFDSMFSEAKAVLGANFVMSGLTSVAFGVPTKNTKNNIDSNSNNIDIYDIENKIDKKLSRYNELMVVADSVEYKTYIENGRLGYAQPLRADFNAVQIELNYLTDELDELMEIRNKAYSLDSLDYLNKKSTPLVNELTKDDIGSQIIKANELSLNHQSYTINAKTLSDIPTNVYDNLFDPANINFNINGQVISSLEVGILKKLDISDIQLLSQIRNNPIDFYLSNVKKLNKIGLSFDDCVEIFDININKYGVKDSLSAAVTYNDKNIFLTTKYFELESLGMIEPADQVLLSNMIYKSSANIDPDILQQNLSKYLTADEINTLNTIKNSGKMDLTPNEAAALYQYQEAGGHEIINYNRGANFDLNKLEYKMNEFQQNKGTNVIRNLNTGNTIVDEIDSAISKNLNKQTITAVRYCNGVGPDLDLSPILDGTVDPQSLVGMSYDDLANTSYTILYDKQTAYSKFDSQANQYKNKIKIESIIPSGTGAFIESNGGLRNYTVMEFLTRRNTKNNIVNAYWDIDGRLVLQTLLTLN